MQVFAGDAEPLLYCLVNKSSGELKLYYGEQQENAVLAKTDGYYPLWGGEYGNSTITKVIIDASIADYPLTSTKRWFREWSNLSDIDGLTYLNTSNVTDMESMFQGCSKLKSLDLSEFDTKNVTNMNYMFDDCSNLEVVYVGDNWNTASVISSKDMFYGCEVLYGQNGTECLPGKLTAEYAHIDDGVSNPGYFTGVNQNAYKPAAPEGKQAYAVLDGTELTFRYDNNMPADAYPLKKFGSPWPTTLTKVIFHESFADYYPISCDGWFSRCSDLTEIVDMEKYLNTDEVLSMHWMFTDCGNLANINLSHFNTEKVTDMCAMFVGCPASLDVSNFKTDNVTDMSDMFCACSGLTTLDVSNFNTANVTDMSGMFSGCSNLTTLDVSGFDTRNVINMGSMFNGCKNLTELDVSNFNTSNVTDMSKMFGGDYKGCEKLTTLNLCSFNTSKVVDMSGMFLWCSNLTELDLSSFNTANVQSMDLMFFVGGMGDNHTSGNLTTVYVSDNWSTESLLGDATMIFSDCKLVGGEGTSFEEQAQLATTEELRMRYRSKYFARVDDPENGKPGYFTYKSSTQEDNREAYAVFDATTGILTFKYDTQKPDGAFEIKESGYPDWCSSASDIKKVKFEESFAEFTPTNCSYWFWYCKNLSDIEGINNLVTDNVTDMSMMFYYCSTIGNLDLSNFNTTQVTNMNCMFLNCTNLATVYVGNNWITNNVTSYNNIFYGCDNLYGGNGTRCTESDILYARIDGGATDPGYFTQVGQQPFKLRPYVKINNETLTFLYDENKTSDDFSLNVFNTYNWQKRLSTITKVVFDQTFASYAPTSCAYWLDSCYNVTEIVDMDKYLNTENVTDMTKMFANCSSLKSIDLSGFNTNQVEDMFRMFAGCANLETIYVGNNWNTDKVKSSDYMFYGCEMLYGEKGTECVPDKEDASFAHIDKGTSDPGYFTQYGNTPYTPIFNCDEKQPYAVVDNGVLTFYCDNKRPAKSFSMPKFEFDDTSWKTIAGDFTKVVFDESFKDYTPTDLSYWFYYCTNLASIEGIENLNTSEVTSMSLMFSNCSSLKNLDLTGLNTSKVEGMTNMFYYCTNLETLDLSGFDTKNLKWMGWMFCGCSNLTTIYAGDNWTTDKVEESYNMFGGCDVLVGGQGTACTGGGVDQSTYARIDDPDNGKPGYFTYKSSTQEDNREPYALLTDNGETVTFYYDEDKSKHEDALGFDFDWSPGWKDVKVAIFDESFKEYKPTSCERWFHDCTQLTEIHHLDYLNTEDVTDMQWMFMGCENLGIIDVSKFNTSKVTNMNMMFYNCSRITELNLSSFDNSQAEYDGIMFYLCKNLTTIYVDDKWITREHDRYFGYCPKLIGGQGTLYNENNKINNFDSPYARIDGGETAPGYFTRKGTTKPEVKSIAITTLPKTAYVLGEELNTDNGELAVTIENRNPQPHDFQGVTITGYDNSKLGKQTLTVEFLGATTTYDIEIAAVAPTDTTLTAPAKLSYLEGDELDLTGGKITIVYNNKTTEDIALTNADVTISAFDNTKLGEQVIIVKYKGVEIGSFTVTVNAKPEPQPENPYTEPEVVDNVYQISSASELLYFMFDVNNGNVSANAVLLNDIVVNADLLKQIADLLKSTSKAAPVLTEWQPIGTAKNAYRGTFDGNGHTISGIYIKDETQNNVGLFGNVAPEAVIKNLGVTDSYIAGNENVGAICGKSEGTIVNCYTVSEVKGSKNVNHLVGAKETAAVVENCYYLAETPVANDPCAKTAEEFLSGNVAQLLSQGAVINGVTYSGETFAGVTELPGTDIIPQPENNDNPSTPISSISENNIKVWSYNHTIYIENAPADTKYTIIDLNGRIITTSTTKSTREEINTNKSGILILNIDNQSFKVSL